MTETPVNEPTPTQPPPTRPPWYRRHLRRIAAAFIAAGLLIVLAQWVLLPWLLHDRIAAALSDAGVRDARFHVSRATLWGQARRGGHAIFNADYNPTTPWRIIMF